MSISPAAVFELGQSGPIDLAAVQSGLRSEGFEDTISADTCEIFEEDAPPFRTAEVRRIGFPGVWLELGRYCVAVTIVCYDWKYLPDSSADCKRLIRLLRQ